jgi:tetratricopeptide (TPR) repeat protein
MSVHPSLLILLVGLVYILGFGAISVLRRQGLSLRFAAEGLIVTAAGAALVYAVPLHPLLFLIALYAITMRVRLLVDLGNWFAARKQVGRALGLYRFALRLRPDAVGRQLVLINRGVTELEIQDPEAAYRTLGEAMACENARPGAKVLAAGYYNLGLACRRTGREAEAIRRFNEAIDTYPHSIYGMAAQRALKERPGDKEQSLS